ncbi:HelD family protein [Clostridium sp.]
MDNKEMHKEEYLHLDLVNNCIEKKLSTLENDIKKYKNNISNGKENTSDVELISYEKTREKYNDINDAQNVPYFARMDFKFEGEDEPETIYIGKVGMDFDNEEANITDWRTPLGNIYYKGSLGECNEVFVDNKGNINTISGNKLLKRSIEIKNKEIVRIQDLETLAETKAKEQEMADKYLIEVLEASSSSKLKDIIATIQEVQNNIIRQELNKIVYIQGCAGSGKSTIALHRIAYLLYQYNEKLKDEDILVIAPNKLFVEYIGRLLPDLGVINIMQNTFSNFVETIIGKKIDFIKNNIDNQEMKINKFDKGSLAYKNVIDNYINDIIKSIVPKNDLTLYSNVILSRDEFKKIFLEDFSSYKLNERILKAKSYIEKIYNEKIGDYVRLKENEYNLLIEDLKSEAVAYPKLQKEVSEIVNEKEIVIKRILRQAKVILNEYLNQLKEINSLDKYLELVTNRAILGYNSINIISKDDVNSILERGKQGLFEDDLAAILYLHSKINLINRYYFKHIVIDESQDLSPFEIYSLRSYVYNNSFTIVGDINQRIIPNKLSYDEELINYIFEDKVNLKTYKLSKSYRSSYEIMMFAKEILKFNSVNKDYLPEPIERHGSKPMIIGKGSDEEIISEIKELVDNRDKRYLNVAIVFRNIQNCKKYYNLIKDKLDINLITEEKNYNGGICIFPAYLTKGLEFDMVIIGDCDNKNYRNNQLETNLLYVQSSRAMHSLTIMYSGAMSPLLTKIGKEFYDEKETDREKLIKIKALKDSLLTILTCKFGSVNEKFEEIIKEEFDYNEIQQLIMKASIVNNINEIFADKNVSKLKEVEVIDESVDNLIEGLLDD